MVLDIKSDNTDKQIILDGIESNKIFIILFFYYPRIILDGIERLLFFQKTNCGPTQNDNP